MTSRLAGHRLEISASKLDIIGDVHGCAVTLERLLERLGYSRKGGVFQHPERKVIFVGDIIDRGPRIRHALGLVRDMVDAGNAILVLGNHELHALFYCLPNPRVPSNYLRPRTPRNAHIIEDTLEQFANYSGDWLDHLRWLKQRPLYFEVPGLRVVHACWDADVIARRCAVIAEDDWAQLADPASSLSRDIKRLTSGVELPLPSPHIMTTAEGFKRHSFRASFWHKNPRVLGDIAFQPDPLPTEVAQLPIDEAIRRELVMYADDQPLLFVGHYWLNGAPRPITSNIACLDYSAVKFGRLVAYRCEGEAQIHPNHFNWVYVDP
ncbi:metallophosphoesterase [Gilvimarinus sp. SDUM040013]|uniref:Metallophosphoesterase n=1 Tax=Gilvimarinus gilvus TaxID=3058038 RepID=A0ABU4S3T9_9GAMM|nr:metallophosphoesterase [Gilvimarinus sp. SDUM040013]MDO3385557.1 metallophosphoesterase [Gilvimarinus sp. SDUM040013]MDX6851192.1 metallophosphoesterase [Gilvimarinus sp. SDUM040013]